MHETEWDGFQHGLKSPDSGELKKKKWRIVSKDPEISSRLNERCGNKAGGIGNHIYAVIGGAQWSRASEPIHCGFAGIGPEAALELKCAACEAMRMRPAVRHGAAGPVPEPFEEIGIDGLEWKHPRTGQNHIMIWIADEGSRPQ